MSDKPKERWQTKITSLKQAVTQIFSTKEFSDVIFVVKGERFEGHRLVLASRSPEFARILLCMNSPEEFVVDNEMITEKGFEILLRFIYTDSIGTTDKRSIIEAYLAALYYKQKTLLEKCEEEIKSWVISVDEVLELLDAGSSVPVLKQKCIHFIRNNGMKVISSPSFLNTNLKTLCAVVQSGALDNIPAVERIKSIMKWGKNRHPEAEGYSVVRNELLDCEVSPLSKLGFETLDLNDVSYIVNNYRGLLDATEVMNMLMYCSSRNEALLPEWCIPVTTEAI